MKKYISLIFLLFLLISLVGCSLKSMNEIRERVKESNFIVDIEYTIITEKTKKFLFFNFSSKQKESNNIKIEKKDGIYYLINDDTLTECSNAYFFWFEALSDENFNKGIFKYNSDLDKINKQISLNKSDLYDLMLRELILKYGDNILHDSSEITEFSIATKNDNLDQATLLFKLFEYNLNTTVYLSIEYSFSNFEK